MRTVVIVFDRPIRIGLEVARVVGPFDSIEAALLWHDALIATAKVELPAAVVETMMPS